MNREYERQNRRLLTVAQACREAKDEFFTMLIFGHSCGTPGCALGNYAARRDLQRTFKLVKKKRNAWQIIMPMWLSDNYGNELYEGNVDQKILDHFGITESEADELFGEDGCEGAQTGVEAAEFIERFVERRTINPPEDKL